MNEIKLIETNGHTIAIVEVPECDKIEIAIDSKSSSIQCTNWDEDGLPDDTSIQIDLPSGNWHKLGLTTELSEEQMKEICDFHYMQGENGEPDYLLWFDHVKDCYHLNTLNESYLSLLEANGICDRNPYTKPKNSDEWGFNAFENKNDLDKWQEAQSKVKTYLILIKK